MACPRKNLPLLLLVLVLIACGSPPSGAELVESERPRIASPGVTGAELAELVQGNHAFTFDLYQELKKGSENLFYSPYSILLAAGMVYAGARGETERQMAETLHYPLAQDRLHPAFNRLDLALVRRGEGAEAGDGQGFRLNVVNALWAQQGYSLLPGFLDLLAENYGAGLRQLDFTNATDASRRTINDWVREQTEGRIEDLLPRDAVDSTTRLVLTNAIYFNAAWKQPFNGPFTEGGTFHLLDGRTVTVPMMSELSWRFCTAGDGYQMVEVPYDGDELSMVILVPDLANFTGFEDSLDAERFDTILAQLEWRLVRLAMPRFELESGFRLKDILSRMGMPVAFSMSGADFSGMTGRRELFISDVFHKTFVSVDEAGTEAAAATGFPIPPGWPKEGPVEITVDRPFLFLIRDIGTGAILFMGRVVHPGG